MKRRLITAGLVAGLAITARADSAAASQARRSAGAVERRIPVAGASLYSRAIGRGQPVIVLHGGPDFDHRYLLPELDRLADRFRLIYHDQRAAGTPRTGCGQRTSRSHRTSMTSTR